MKHHARTSRCGVLALLGCAAAGALAQPAAEPAPRDRLRFIVQELCLPHWLHDHDPAPCESVTPAAEVPGSAGFAILHDRKGGAHFLLIPTQIIRGVESPEARAPGAPNYFDAAWQARAVLAQAIGRAVPRSAVGLAVNQIHARSQDQLHIHISCLRPDVAATLAAEAPTLDGTWRTLELEGSRYQAMRIMGERPDTANPFRLLAAGVPDADKSMADFTLLLGGMEFGDGPGFVLLAGNRVPGAELMLDPLCALAPRGTN